MTVLEHDISQASVVIRLRCGGGFDDHFNTDLLLIVLVKGF